MGQILNLALNVTAHLVCMLFLNTNLSWVLGAKKLGWKPFFYLTEIRAWIYFRQTGNQNLVDLLSFFKCFNQWEHSGLIQGRHKVWKSGGARSTGRGWCAPPGWDRVCQKVGGTGPPAPPAPPAPPLAMGL